MKHLFFTVKGSCFVQDSVQKVKMYIKKEFKFQAKKQQSE